MNNRRDDIRKLVRDWSGNSVRETEGATIFDLGLLSGLAYATGPGLTKLRCTIWLDDPVDEAEARAWVDVNDDAPFGGLNVVRFKDENAPQLGGAGIKREPDELALRFVFTERFDHPRIGDAPDIAREFARRWHWRYVDIPDDATQAVVDLLIDDDRDQEAHSFHWYSDDASRAAGFSRQITRARDEQSDLAAGGVARVVAEVCDITTMELGKVRAVAEQKWAKRISEDIRARPWLVLPGRRELP